jgi:tRNA-modifying protein YgfZ
MQMESGVMLYDASHWGRVKMGDADRLTFLHNQSTNAFKSRQPGEGCDTVFLSSTARTIDLSTAYILPESILLTLSPGMAETVMKFLDRYIFFADKVTLTDVTEKTAMFQLIWPDSDTLLTQLGVTDLIGQPYGTHQLVTIADQEVRLAVGNGLALPGYTVIVDASAATTVWQALLEANAQPIEEETWQALRIQQGRPVPEKELTDDYNPLEAGLWHTISFNKGCYIGQETIARLDTYNGVKQQLWGFKTDQAVSPETVVMVDTEKVGKVTSVIQTESGCLGLAYVKTKAGGAGLPVTIADQTAVLLDLPLLTRTKC